MTIVCSSCGCQALQARADARTLNLQQELQCGIYTCCQVVAWADEQWLAWVQAAEEDGRSADEVTRPLEYMETEAVPLLTPLSNVGRHGPAEEKCFSGISGGDRHV